MGGKPMRPMEVTFPKGAQKELEELLKKEKRVRVFRRTQAILEVVKGKTVNTIIRGRSFP
jgi:hypothetical protein